jgi:hypothetical protein
MKNYLDLETAHEYLLLVDAIHQFIKAGTYSFNRVNALGTLAQLRLIARSKILDAIYRLKPGMTPEIQFDTPLEDIIQTWRRVRAKSRIDLADVKMPDVFYKGNWSDDETKAKFDVLYQTPRQDITPLAKTDTIRYSQMVIQYEHEEAQQRYIAAEVLISLCGWDAGEVSTSDLQTFLLAEIDSLYGYRTTLELITRLDPASPFYESLVDSGRLLYIQSLVQKIGYKQGNSRAMFELELVNAVRARAAFKV